MSNQGKSTKQIVVEPTDKQPKKKSGKLLFNNLKHIKWPQFTNNEIYTSQLVKVQRINNCKVLSHKWDIYITFPQNNSGTIAEKGTERL